MNLELDVGGELETVLERLAANSERADGGEDEVSPEEVAEELLRQAAAERYRQIVLEDR